MSQLYHLHGVKVEYEALVEIVVIAENEPAARKIAASNGGTEYNVKNLPDYNIETEHDIRYTTVGPDDPRNPWLSVAKCDVLGPFASDVAQYPDGVVVRDVLEA
jgi:hypothetical protein